MTKQESRYQHELIRQRSLLMTRYIAATVEVSVIRKTCLESIVRWRKQGTNSLLWDDWVKLLIGGSDEQLIKALIDDADEWSRNLRRATPCAGLVNSKIREYIFSRPLTNLPTIQNLIEAK